MGRARDGRQAHVPIMLRAVTVASVPLVAVMLAVVTSVVSDRLEPKIETGDSAAAAVKSVQTSPDALRPVTARTGTARLRLLGANDFHGNLQSPDEVGGRAVGGAAHMSAYLDALEDSGNRETLRVHAGDMVGASPLASSHYRDEPAVRAMNGMGFDVGTVGNHEFDRGMDEMTRLISGGPPGNSDVPEDTFSGASFPYLAANVVERESRKSVLPPYDVMEADGVRVGFIGVVTPETEEITDPTVADSVDFLDISDTVNRYTEELRREGVETVVVLAHSGGVESDGEAGGEIVTETRQMADAVDVVFGGHTHSRMDTRVGGKVVVESGAYGEAVSVVDLDVDRKSGDVVGSGSRLVTTYNDALRPDGAMQALTDRYVRGVSGMANREVGVAATDVTREYTEAGENALGDLIADARREYTGADFAFVLSGAMRDDLSAGTVTYGDLFAANPGQNDLTTTELSGEQVRRVLEAQFQEGPDRRLQVSGLLYNYDTSLPEGRRVTSITLPDGSPVVPEATYTVAAEEYISRGGNGFEVFADGEGQRRVGKELDATVSYIEGLPQPFVPPDPSSQPRVRGG